MGADYVSSLGIWHSRNDFKGAEYPLNFPSLSVSFLNYSRIIIFHQHWLVVTWAKKKYCSVFILFHNTSHLRIFIRYWTWLSCVRSVLFCLRQGFLTFISRDPRQTNGLVSRLMNQN
jgi:hypothetical protein